MAFHILVLSVSAGAGHVRAAEAVCAAARAAQPPSGPRTSTCSRWCRGTFASCTVSRTSSWSRSCRSSGRTCIRESTGPSRDTVIGKAQARRRDSSTPASCDAEIARLAAGRHPVHAFPARRAVVAAARRGKERCRRSGCRSPTSTCTRCGCTRTWTATAWPATKWRSGSRIAACRAGASTSPAFR